MTRINSNIDPSTLKRAHLIAEFREIIMVPAALRRSLRTIPPETIKKTIPKSFTLNKGHVKFFYDKLAFLQSRFTRLADEMERRGYKPNRQRIVAFDGFDKMWYNQWESTPQDDQIVLDRIALRISQKPHLYKE